MISNNKILNNLPKKREQYQPFLEELASLFTEMDSAYNNTAAQYEFICKGCTDNCCMTRFYHHTLAEYLFIESGFRDLAPDIQQIACQESAAVKHAMQKADETQTPFQRMCPLNRKERCILYAHRPMICRLHGIPHELRRPGQAPSFGPGCNDFNQQTQKKEYIPFNRTPFYIQMAQLEKNIRDTTGFHEKIKMTIADMVILCR